MFRILIEIIFTGDTNRK